MKKKNRVLCLACMVALLFAGCAISVSIAIPALNLNFTVQPLPQLPISSLRAELPGEVTANMHWDEVDTQGRRLRNLHLNMEVSLTAEATLDFDTFDFELYMKEQEATDTEFFFNAGTISPATDTYTWTLDKDNSPAVNELLNFINDHKATDLVFTFRHDYGADGQQGSGTAYEDIQIRIRITGTAEVIII